MSTRIDSREAVKTFKKVYLPSRWSQIPHGRGFQPPQQGKAKIIAFPVLNGLHHDYQLGA